MTQLTASTLALAATLTTAAAHHGRDFLLVQDYHVPAPFTGILYGNFDFSSQNGPDEWAFEPGIQYGIGNRFSLGLSADFADEGDDWHYRSISPQVQFQLTDPAANIPIRFAVVAGYQFADEEGEEEEHHEDARVSPRHEGEDHEEEVHAAHGHGGIHQHGSDGFFARLIMETDLTKKDKLVLNVICVSPDDGETAFGYAAGIRHSFNHDFAAGIEAIGDFDNDGWHEVLAAGYFSPVEGLTLKLGVGAGLTGESPEFTVHGGAVWRF